MGSDSPLPEDWSSSHLGDVAEVILSNVDKKIAVGERGIRLCNYTDVYYNRYIDSQLRFSKGTATDRELARFQIQPGDVLITKDSEDRHDIAVPGLVTEPLPGVLCGYHLAIIRPENGALHGGFLSAILQFHPTRHEFSRLANGVTRFGLTTDSIRQARVPLPPLAEQTRIANIVRTCDNHIAQTRAMIRNIVRVKRGMMQQLLTGKRRFPGFRTAWAKHRLGDVLEEANRVVRVDDSFQYRLVSIRRRSGGFFDREPRFGRDIGYDSLKMICTGDFVIARRQVIHGAMALAQEEFDGAYVSNAYATLVSQDQTRLHMPLLDYMSQTPSMYYKAFRCSYGVALEKMFFNLCWFLDEEVFLPPSVSEQTKIAAVFQALDREVGLLRRKLAFLQDQKKGLMQKLLTGQVRVKETCR